MRLSVALEVGVAILIAVLGAIVAVEPESLGMNSIVRNWIGIALVGLGPLSAYLGSSGARRSVNGFGRKMVGR